MAFTEIVDLNAFLVWNLGPFRRTSRRYWRTMVGRNSESETGQRQKREAAGLNDEGGAKRSREDKERLGSPAVCCRCSVCKTVFLNDRTGETEVLLGSSRKKQR